MRSSRTTAVFAILILAAVSSSGQDRTTWRTAADIQEGTRGIAAGTVADVDASRNQIHLEPDDDRGPRIIVFSDSVSTTYTGFGGVINGQPEIFTGSQGLSNVRPGDRIEVRGIGRPNNSIRADNIALRGRAVAANPTGVGTTRSPGSVSTPTASGTSTADRVGSVEGVVQEINPGEGRIVIVTDRREVMTVRGSSTTPVIYRNETYRIANLEIGDRIRIEPEPSGGYGSELRARSIQVTRSAQEGTATPRSTSVVGRVTRVDRSLDIVNVDTGRTSVRADIATSSDPSGRRVRANDFSVGDQVELTGRYSPTASDLFIATTVRFTGDVTPPGREGTMVDVYGGSAEGGELGAVTIYGTVRETLDDSPQLVLRDSSGRTFRLNLLDDFVVRGKGGVYTTADKLKVGDSLVVKAYRDGAGNYIAQTVRVR